MESASDVWGWGCGQGSAKAPPRRRLGLRPVSPARRPLSSAPGADWQRPPNNPCWRDVASGALCAGRASSRRSINTLQTEKWSGVPLFIRSCSVPGSALASRRRAEETRPGKVPRFPTRGEPNSARDALHLRAASTSGPAAAPARWAQEPRPAAFGAYLLLSEQHPPFTLFLLLPGLGLITPHAGDIVLVPDVPALLGQDVHGAVTSTDWQTRLLALPIGERMPRPSIPAPATDWSWINGHAPPSQCLESRVLSPSDRLASTF